MASPLPPRYRSVLRRYSEERGGQQAIADDLGVCRATVNRWLRGDGCRPLEEVTEYVERLLVRRPDLDDADLSDTIKDLRDRYGIPREKARLIATMITV